MFGLLMAYKDQAYYEEHPYIQFDTLSLSTCEYSVENGRMAIVAKKVQ